MNTRKKREEGKKTDEYMEEDGGSDVIQIDEYIKEERGG